MKMVSVSKSPLACTFLTHQAGCWTNSAPIPDISLEQMEQRLEGEEKRLLIAFIKKMLWWDPEQRENSEDLYVDEWLLADLIASGEIVEESCRWT